MSTSSKTDGFDLYKDYKDFVRYEISTGISVDDIPTYVEFSVMREEYSDKDKLLAAISPTSSKISKSAAGFASNTFVRSLMDAGVDAVSEEGVRIAADIANRLAGGDSFVKIKREFGDTGGNSGNSSGGDGSPGNPFNQNRMNFNPKPVQVRLDTGIRSRGYGDYYPESRGIMNVLELTQVEFRVPENAGSELKGYFDTVITFNFQNDAQMRINFNVDAINNFSASNLQQWMNRYARAYGKYVWYTQIINYCNEPLQQNAGMRALRSMMTPALLDDLAQLENMLDGTPAPPEFREMVHFIYGASFKVSSNPGSQIRLISPSVLQHSAVAPGQSLDTLPANDLQAAINDLFNMRQTTALISKVCPNWIPGRGNTAAGATVSEYSPAWSTLWENLPFNVYANGADHYGPVVAGQDQDTAYGSSADVLDGAITALWNGYDTNSTATNPLDKYRPGTIIPKYSYCPTSDPSVPTLSNRISYKFDSATNTSGYYLVSLGSNQFNYMRCESHTVTTNGVIHPVIWPGRELINNINIASARQTCYELYSKMFRMSPGKDRPFNNDKGNSGKRRRGGKARMETEESI